MERTNFTGSRAFTLVELLVAIAILISLTALIFAFFKGGREAALSAKCVNNLKQIAITSGAITSDSNGYIVHAGRTPVGGGPSRNWAMHYTTFSRPELSYQASKWSEINDQVETVEMLNCPAAYREHKLEMAEHNGQARWRTYGLNTRLGLAPGQWNGGGGSGEFRHIDGAYTLEQIEDASITICASEPGWNGRAFRAAFGPWSTKENSMGQHHRGGFHVSYWDGHVEKLQYEEFPYAENEMADGRTVRLRTGNNATETDKYFSMVWRGTRYARSMPKVDPDPTN
jgi:prepilin-type N-terminal cleavage/methylation domain-containing protein/prepilin-type processing-associated H-X9-DG protein